LKDLYAGREKCDGKKRKYVMEKSLAMDTGKRTALYSLMINIILTAVKMILTLLSGSTAVLSEAVHSLTDVLGNLSVLMGISISRKKSYNFPWGLYKVENIVAILSSLLIFLVAYEVIKNTLLRDAKQIIHINASVMVLGFLAFPIYLFARFEKKRAVQLNSPSLMADAQHWVSDIAALGVVIIGLLASRFFPYADIGAALIIVFIILRVGYKIIKNSMKSLLDASVDKKTLEIIRDIAKGINRVEEITALHARNSGSFIFVQMDVRLFTTKLKTAHELSHVIERTIRERVPFIERVSIHYEPVTKDYRRHAVPLENRNGVISEHFGTAPWIALWDIGVSNPAMLSQEIIENPFANLEKGKGIRLAELLIDKGVDILFTKEIFKSKGPQYVLSDAEIEVKETVLKNLSELVKLNERPS
jgi:cation diffusion facilitator family transporter